MYHWFNHPLFVKGSVISIHWKPPRPNLIDPTSEADRLQLCSPLIQIPACFIFTYAPCAMAIITSNRILMPPRISQNCSRKSEHHIHTTHSAFQKKGKLMRRIGKNPKCGERFEIEINSCRARKVQHLWVFVQSFSVGWMDPIWAFIFLSERLFDGTIPTVVHNSHN